MQENKRALIVEGGGSRGVFSFGVIDSFIQASYNPFDIHLGVSNGAVVQLWYLLNEADYNLGKNGNRSVGSLYDLIRAENKTTGARGKNFKGVGQWNNARIIVNGGKVEHWLNHVKVVEFVRFSQTFEALVEKSKYEIWEQFGRWPEGVILLQDHGDKVSFKNIKIREF